MKITKDALKQLIKEELEKVLDEQELEVDASELEEGLMGDLARGVGRKVAGLGAAAAIAGGLRVSNKAQAAEKAPATPFSTIVKKGVSNPQELKSFIQSLAQSEDENVRSLMNKTIDSYGKKIKVKDLYMSDANMDKKLRAANLAMNQGLGGEAGAAAALEDMAYKFQIEK